MAKGGTVRAHAKRLGAGVPHADAAARFLDAAALRQRLDKGDLLVRRPAVLPSAERGGCEGDFWFANTVLLEPYWNTNEEM